MYQLAADSRSIDKTQLFVETCTSMAPGSTYIPRTSTTCAPPGVDLPSSRLVITPSETCTSTSRGPSGVWTVPPAMTSERVSVKFQVSDAEYDLFTSYFVPPGPTEGFNVVVHKP